MEGIEVGVKYGKRCFPSLVVAVRKVVSTQRIDAVKSGLGEEMSYPGTEVI